MNKTFGYLEQLFKNGDLANELQELLVLARKADQLEKRDVDHWHAREENKRREELLYARVCKAEASERALEKMTNKYNELKQKYDALVFSSNLEGKDHE